MTNNFSNFKKRTFPSDYENGPVKIFTREEIDEWERTRYDEVYTKISRQAGLTERDIKHLDGLGQMQAELLFGEILEGTSEGGPDGES
jgi:hypothetical protein